MKPELEKLCTAFIANMEAVKKAFRWNDSAVYPVCANILCACGYDADAERLKECRKWVEEQTGRFSRFRGKIRPILCCMLAVADKPEDRITLADEYHKCLKQEFRDTDYLALAALLLSASGEDSRITEWASRGRELFRRMDKEHLFLTNNTDSVFALILALTDKTDDALIVDMEACYRLLKTEFSSSGDVQSAAQILAVADGEPDVKAQRVIDLYNALHEAGVAYGHAGELAPLAALSLTDIPIPVLVEEIREADAFLEAQKDYGGKSPKREERALQAAMIVSNQYADTGMVNSSMMTHTLDVLISSQRARYISLTFELLQSAAQLLARTKESTEEAENKTGGESEQAEQPEAQDASAISDEP